MNIKIQLANASTEINYADILFAQRRWIDEANEKDWGLVYNVNNEGYVIEFETNENLNPNLNTPYKIYNTKDDGNYDPDDYICSIKVKESLELQIREANKLKGITEITTKGEFIYDALVNNQPDGFWMEPSQRGLDIMAEVKLQLIALGNGIFSGHPERGWTYTTIAEKIDSLDRRTRRWNDELTRQQSAA